MGWRKDIHTYISGDKNFVHLRYMHVSKKGERTQEV